jgi:hypothetical protein
MVSASFLAPAEDRIGDRIVDGYPDKPREQPENDPGISHSRLMRPSSSGAVVEVALADGEVAAT